MTIDSVHSMLQDAISCLQRRRFDEAELRFKQVLERQPSNAGALNLLAILLMQLRRFGEAEHYIRLAWMENAKSDATAYNYGVILKSLHRPIEALHRFGQALEINPSIAETWTARGAVFNDLGQYDNAIRDFDKAISLSPVYAEAFYNKGNSLAALMRYNEAITAYLQAVALRSNLAEAWLGLGRTFHENQRYDDALAAFEKAISINPNLNCAMGARLYTKLHLCDWRNLEFECADLVSAVRKGAVASPPFSLLSVPSAPSDQLKCAELYISENHAASDDPIWRGEAYSHDRIRVAYLSSDFHRHATAFLTAGMFEHHDRSLFETTALSFGPDQESAMRERLRTSFDRFVDVQQQGDRETAELIRELEIDIAIDLKGLTQNARPNILAQRPAPIQVSYLGYPGTMGTKYIDYIIADRIVIPQDEQQWYSEKVVYLPESYQANDSMRQIADSIPSRGKAGLPSNGFVFCSFNNSYKINPIMFPIWMRLLRQVDGSVLWLLEANATACSNLRGEAEAQGINPDRLIFAQRVPHELHLARHSLADLFLDTLPCNAHTTASDALWSGLPLITCLGTTFAGRVAASLLTAVGLPELVTRSLEDYEALAGKLAREPLYLAAIKAKLLRFRSTHPLFNTQRFVRYLESAYKIMFERNRRGEPPSSFDVAEWA